jgi:hypothetical protein
MKRSIILSLVFLTACAGSSAHVAVLEADNNDRKPVPKTVCKTLNHGVPIGLDAESVALWARRELDRSDAMIGSCQSSISRLKSHIGDIIDDS